MDLFNLEAMNADTDYEDHLVVRVVDEGVAYSVYIANNVAFGLPKSYGVAPKTGDTVRLYPSGRLGGVIRGVVLNDKIVYYQTAQKARAQALQERDEARAHDYAAYIANRATYEAQFAALPDIFQARITGFRNANPEFWRFEPYELFTCGEAVKIAAVVQADEISAFYELPFERQQEIVPDLSDGHSGNTFGAACSLARIYLERPDMIPAAHGATLVPAPVRVRSLEQMLTVIRLLRATGRYVTEEQSPTRVLVKKGNRGPLLEPQPEIHARSASKPRAPRATSIERMHKIFLAIGAISLSLTPLLFFSHSLDESNSGVITVCISAILGLTISVGAVGAILTEFLRPVSRQD
jgi:hypothetical protein